MKRSGLLIILMALITLVVTGTTQSARGDARAGQVQWLGDLAEANRLRASTPKPTMIFFFNNVARPSYEMRVETLADPQVRSQLSKFICVAINQQQQPQIAESFKLIKVPTTIFLDHEGREIDRLVGLKTVGDFMPYLNRATEFIAAGGTQATAGDAFADAAIDLRNPGEGTTKVTFNFSDPRARNVSLVGDFNDWRLESLPLRRTAQGIWTIDLHLRQGVYEYLFYLDGDQYRPDFTNQFRKVNPYGGFNSVVIIGTPKMSPVVQGRMVTFIVYNADARNIEVSGTFNNWENLTMYRNPQDPNMWGVRYELPPGLYQYKFIVDGEWQVDPENYSPIEDEHGNFNSAFLIR